MNKVIASIKKLPDQQYLLECFNYDPDTGILTWKARPEHHFKSIGKMLSIHKLWAGKPVGYVGTKGHSYVHILSASYAAHRIIWKMWYGIDPPQYVDHINGDKTDNRIANLREATNNQNQMNQRRTTRISNIGVTGVSYHKRDKSYRAYMRINGENKHLGNYKNLQDAIKARQEAELVHQGEFSPRIYEQKYGEK